jgi:uncharacterized protein (DUF2164 family)
MSETNEEALATQEVVQEQKTEENKAMSYDDGIIKVNLNELNNTTENAIPEQKTDASDDTIGQPENSSDSKEMVEEVQNTVQNEEQPVQEEPESVIEEIQEEKVQEQVVDLQEDIQEAIAEQKELGVELPENIQKVVDFINETGGSLEDYVKLNTDYSSLNDDQLLREYYETTKPHLDKEEIDFLMEDNFSYDGDIDDEVDIKRKKLAKKEELSKAKQHLDSLKTKYYEEIKAGSKLNPEQQKAIEFFNRYKKENAEAAKLAEQQVSTFKNKTEKLFSNDFKGFDFNVGEKQFRFKVNNVDQVKDTQSDINNFVKKFLNEKNEISDAAGYHKSLFTAMNADKIAQHFYEQGKADAIKQSVAKAKNIDMSPRGTHESVEQLGGFKVKAINPGAPSKFGIKTRK